MSWRERLARTGTVVTIGRRTLRLVWSVSPGLLITMAVCALLDAGTLVVMAWVGKEIIDAIVAAVRDPMHPAGPALTWVSIELAIVVARSAITYINTYAQVVLRAKLGLHVNLAILEKAANVSYGNFEDPAFMNRMNQARREASSRPLDLIFQIMAFVRNGVTIAGFAALVSGLGWWAVLVLLFTALPPFLSETKFGREGFELQRARSLRNRQLYYLENVLSTEQSVKEVKLFALARWLMDRYRDIHLGFEREETGLARRRLRAGFVVGTLSSLGLYGAYVLIAILAVRGRITLGETTLYVMLLRQGQQALGAALSAVAKMYEHNLYMSNLFEYLAQPDDEPDEAIAAETVLPPAAPRVVFENVSFQYPGSEAWALKDVSLTLEPGETLALVGRNGAGKTTLVKLLVGLYAPTSGRILVDGRDVATMSRAELRRQVGVIFQDFAKFQLSARDNVGVGWLPKREDDEAVSHAVDEAGAREVVDRLPKGLDTPLGRAFGGDDLSIGQWQRVALARAFMRRSKMLVLDEPTASLDAEAEHEIFRRFGELKAGRTALLITHRFGSVKMADRIVVFEGGRIVEEGTHAELIARGGQYAHLFELQAAGYQIEPEGGAPTPESSSPDSASPP